MGPIEFIQKELLKDRTNTGIKAGDNVNISYKIIEGDKEKNSKF